MKSKAHDGRDGWATRGSKSDDTLTNRLTGVDGTWRAKCTKSMMNRLGPEIGRKLPFDSCIHAPRRDHDARAARREVGSASGRHRNAIRPAWEAEGLGM